MQYYQRRAALNELKKLLVFFSQVSFYKQYLKSEGQSSVELTNIKLKLDFTYLHIAILIHLVLNMQTELHIQESANNDVAKPHTCKTSPIPDRGDNSLNTSQVEMRADFSQQQDITNGVVDPRSNKQRRAVISRKEDTPMATLHEQLVQDQQSRAAVQAMLPAATAVIPSMLRIQGSGAPTQHKCVHLQENRPLLKNNVPYSVNQHNLAQQQVQNSSAIFMPRKSQSKTTQNVQTFPVQAAFTQYSRQSMVNAQKTREMSPGNCNGVQHTRVNQAQSICAFGTPPKFISVSNAKAYVNGADNQRQSQILNSLTQNAQVSQNSTKNSDSKQSPPWSGSQKMNLTQTRMQGDKCVNVLNVTPPQYHQMRPGLMLPAFSPLTTSQPLNQQEQLRAETAGKSCRIESKSTANDPSKKLTNLQRQQQQQNLSRQKQTSLPEIKAKTESVVVKTTERSSRTVVISAETNNNGTGILQNGHIANQHHQAKIYTTTQTKQAYLQNVAFAQYGCQTHPKTGMRMPTIDAMATGTSECGGNSVKNAATCPAHHEQNYQKAYRNRINNSVQNQINMITSNENTQQNTFGLEQSPSQINIMTNCLQQRQLGSALKVQKLEDTTQQTQQPQQPLLNLSFCGQHSDPETSNRLTPMDRTMPPPQTKNVFNDSQQIYSNGKMPQEGYSTVYQHLLTNGRLSMTASSMSARRPGNHSTQGASNSYRLKKRPLQHGIQSAKRAPKIAREPYIAIVAGGTSLQTTAKKKKGIFLGTDNPDERNGTLDMSTLSRNERTVTMEYSNPNHTCDQNFLHNLSDKISTLQEDIANNKHSSEKGCTCVTLHSRANQKKTEPELEHHDITPTTLEESPQNSNECEQIQIFQAKEDDPNTYVLNTAEATMERCESGVTQDGFISQPSEPISEKGDNGDKETQLMLKEEEEKSDEIFSTQGTTEVQNNSPILHQNQQFGISLTEKNSVHCSQATLQKSAFQYAARLTVDTNSKVSMVGRPQLVLDSESQKTNHMDFSEMQKYQEITNADVESSNALKQLIREGKMLNEEQRLQAASRLTQMHFVDNQYSPSPDNQPFHSCKSYAIVDCQNSKILFSKQADEVREMASLTKMMTAYVSLQLVDEFRMNMKNTYFPVSKHAASIIGTSASLIEGQCVTIYDLLRGLMLPSGNDAALCLAENFGHRIMFTKRPGEVRKPSICYKQPGQTYGSNKEKEEEMETQGPKAGVRRFVKEMNRVAASLHLKYTNFANPHGLADKANHSSAFELGKLACHCMRNSKEFNVLVTTKVHNAVTYLPISKAALVLKIPEEDLKQYITKAPFQQSAPTSPTKKSVGKYHMQMMGERMRDSYEFVAYPQTWLNSNKLLSLPGFLGVKTGVTATAGSCLCVAYENKLLKKRIVTVVLGCRNTEYRWKDARRLTLWADQLLQQQYNASQSPTKCERSSKDVGQNLIKSRFD